VTEAVPDPRCGVRHRSRPEGLRHQVRGLGPIDELRRGGRARAQSTVGRAFRSPCWRKHPSAAIRVSDSWIVQGLQQFVVERGVRVEAASPVAVVASPDEVRLTASR